MERDDKLRSRKGVVICLRDLGDGTTRIIFDDVVADTGKNPITWKFSTFYTWDKYDTEALDNMTLSVEEYQRIGENLVARLIAFNRKVK